MSTHAERYAARKAAGQCVLDGSKARPGSVLCAACAARQCRYRAKVRAEEQTRAAALQARMQAAGIYVAYSPQPATSPAREQASAPAERQLLCYGQGWTITHIPLLVPCCNRLWLQETS